MRDAELCKAWKVVGLFSDFCEIFFALLRQSGKNRTLAPIRQNLFSPYKNLFFHNEFFIFFYFDFKPSNLTRTLSPRDALASLLNLAFPL